MLKLLQRSALLLVAMLITQHAAVFAFEADGISYNITSEEAKTVEVVEGPVDYSGDVKIPATVEYDGATFSVTSIAKGAFSDCNKLTGITIPESVTNIDNFAIIYCHSLVHIFVNSETPPTIGTRNFDASNATVYVPANSVSAYSEAEGWSSQKIANTDDFSNDITTIDGITYFITSATENTCEVLTCISSATEATILTSVDINGTTYNTTGINDYAFSECSDLTSFVIPDCVTSIGSNAFFSCSKLTSLTFPSGVTSIADGVCNSCLSLTDVVMPEGVTSIGQHAFLGCTSLMRIDIPASVTSIANGAFNFCSSLLYIFPHNTTPPTIGGLSPSITDVVTVYVPNASLQDYKSSWSQFANIKRIDDFTEVTTTIDGITYLITSENTCEVHRCLSSATEANIRLSVEIGGTTYNVTSIGEEAFSDCYNLASIAIPEGVTSIGSNAFENCSNLKSVTIPEGVTSIGNAAFSGCTSLTNVNIPESLTSISGQLFYGCSSLTSIDIPEDVTNIEYSTFSGCSSLVSVNIPDGVTSISDFVFNNCSSLTSINIPDGVTSIGSNAFNGCSNLTGITIPGGVTTIGEYAFEGCANLNAIYCKTSTPPTLVVSFYCLTVFSNYSATVYVPAGTKASYESAGEWGSFSNIVEVVYAEISPIGYASFASKYAVDFSGQEGLTAYIGKYNEAENTLTLTEVTDAPAETGLVLKGEAGKTYVLALAETTTTTDKGDLKAVTEDAQVNSDMKNYVLSQVDGEVGFYRFTGTDIAAGHSYLELPAATNARAITLSFDNTTTGIGSINAAATTEAQPKACYNLSGQRVAKPTKGLYIIGGKKVVVK